MVPLRGNKIIIKIALFLLMISISDSFHYHKNVLGKSKSRDAKEKCPKVNISSKFIMTLINSESVLVTFLLKL